MIDNVIYYIIEKTLFLQLYPLIDFCISLIKYPMRTHSMPNLRKTKIIHKIRPILTKNQIDLQPYNTINHIFLSKIRKIAYPTLHSKTNQLISFLNLKHKSSNISLHYIPSI